jgi:hypothetical protein
VWLVTWSTLQGQNWLTSHSFFLPSSFPGAIKELTAKEKLLYDREKNKLLVEHEKKRADIEAEAVKKGL